VLDDPARIFSLIRSVRGDTIRQLRRGERDFIKGFEQLFGDQIISTLFGMKFPI